MPLGSSLRVIGILLQQQKRYHTETSSLYNLRENIILKISFRRHNAQFSENLLKLSLENSFESGHHFGRILLVFTRFLYQILKQLLKINITGYSKESQRIEGS